MSVLDFAAVHNLFSDELPGYDEKAPIDPQFETFGGFPSEKHATLQFSNEPTYPRIWLSSDDDNHLVQFQRDRLLLNWRKTQNASNYPRFEGIRPRFMGYLDRVSEYFRIRHAFDLIATQAEVTYINIVPVAEYSEAFEIFQDLRGGADIETLSLKNTHVIMNERKEPIARMHADISSVIIRQTQKKALRFSITVRGPIEDADHRVIEDFFSRAREEIVLYFCDRTSPEYHKIWEKK